MDQRLKLDEKLREILENELGYVNIYFQPPDTIRMKYDCIVYHRQGCNTRKADNRIYHLREQWEVTFISKDPESPVPKVLFESFEYVSPGRPFWNDNLYHYPFTIFY